MSVGFTKYSICSQKHRPFVGKLKRNARDRRRAYKAESEKTLRAFEMKHGLTGDSILPDALERQIITQVRALWLRWIPEHPFPTDSDLFG